MMNLLKIHHQPFFFFHFPKTTSSHQPKLPLQFTSSSPKTLSVLNPSCKLSFVSQAKTSFLNNEEEKEGSSVCNTSSEFDDLAPDGIVYQKTLRLVECSMFAAATGLIYFLSNSLSIEVWSFLKEELLWMFLLIAYSNHFYEMGCCSGKENYGGDGNAIACLVWSCESLILYAYAWFAWFYNGFSVEDGDKLGSFHFLVHHCAFSRCNGITMNIHASLTFIFSATGVNIIPSMNVIYAIFGTLVILNSGFFVFLLHLLYTVFLTRMGMRPSLKLPGWLEKAI